MVNANFQRNAQCVSGDRVPPGEQGTGTAGIERLVARDFGLEAHVLYRSTRGSPREALARQVAMYLHHVLYASSFQAIGRMFGRDRTTVSHACRVIEDGREDAGFDGRLAVLETACRHLSGVAHLSCASHVGGRAA